MFHVTAIAMRRDVLHQSMLHGPRNMARMEATPIGALHTESAVRATLRAVYFREIMDALGSDDGREIVLELDELREEGVLTRGPNWQWELTKTEG